MDPMSARRFAAPPGCHGCLGGWGICRARPLTREIIAGGIQWAGDQSRHVSDHSEQVCCSMTQPMDVNDSKCHTV